jgi:hypothetical protein
MTNLINNIESSFGSHVAKYTAFTPLEAAAGHIAIKVVVTKFWRDRYHLSGVEKEKEGEMLTAARAAWLWLLAKQSLVQV